MIKQVYNPYLPLDEYIPDGEPHVFGDRIYIFGSHDREGGSTYCELDYTVYSAPVSDLTDWKCEGIIYRAVQDPHYCKERKQMYAPDVVQGADGRYYLYYALSGNAGKGDFNGSDFCELYVTHLPENMNIMAMFIMPAENHWIALSYLIRQ